MLNKLGQTDIFVSRIGLGTVKFGRNQGVKYPGTYTLPTDSEIDHLLGLAESFNINLLDTAPAYGESEMRLGKALRGKRERFVICTKVGEQFSDGASHFDFSAQAIKRSLDKSLKQLQTDHVDVLLLHSNGEDLYLIQNQHVFVTLAELKQAGKILSFGMSTKTLAGAMATIDAADVAMITYNPLYTAEKEAIAYAAAQGKGIFIKKAFASGHLNQFKSKTPVQDSLNFIFKEKGVTSVIVGTLNPLHLREIVGLSL